MLTSLMTLRRFVRVAICVFGAAGVCCAQQPSFDILITNAHIIDGTGSPWYAGDIAIREGRIAALGPLGNAPAKQTIDAHNNVVAPGFIDMLGQSELSI